MLKRSHVLSQGVGTKNLKATLRSVALYLVSKAITRGEPALSLAELDLLGKYMMFLESPTSDVLKNHGLRPKEEFVVDQRVVEMLRQQNTIDDTRYWNTYSTILLVFWSQGLSILSLRFLQEHRDKHQASQPFWLDDLRFIPYRHLPKYLPPEKRKAWEALLPPLLHFLDEFSSDRITRTDLIRQKG